MQVNNSDKRGIVDNPHLLKCLYGVREKEKENNNEIKVKNKKKN